MRTLFLSVLTIIFTFTGHCQQIPVPSDKHATPETVNLYQSMWRLQKKGIMFGHQDDLMCGYTWWYEKDRSDTKDVTGDYPAIAGFELGGIELGDSRSLDSVSFEQIAEQVRIHYKRGGIITISWHLRNPLTSQLAVGKSSHHNGSAWDVSSKDVVASILPGGANNDLYNKWLDRLATFFISLKDNKGVPIPFIFRPYHEHSGSFFWWGTGLATDDQYSALWRYTVGFLRDKKNIHNILYAYNTDRVTSLEQYMKGYPGDDIIDFLTIDMYDRGEQFNNELDTALKFVTEAAASKSKIAALSETGQRRGMTDWWSKVLTPIVNKYAVSYVLTWRDGYNIKFKDIPRFSKPFPDDFLNFYNNPRSLFLKKIAAEKVYKRH